MDVLDLWRRYSARLARWWLPVGVGVGVAAGWGIGHTDCAFKRRGGGCFIELPGERAVVGAVVWGVLVAVFVATLLRLKANRHVPSRDSRDGHNS